MISIPDEDLIRRVRDCTAAVIREIGTGLSRDIHETCLAMELTKAGLKFERGRVLPLIYRGVQLDFRCRTDVIVADVLLLRVEAADAIDEEHEKRLRTCIWMGGFPLALMLNFNVVEIDDGIATMTPRLAGEESGFDEPEPGFGF